MVRFMTKNSYENIEKLKQFLVGFVDSLKADPSFPVNKIHTVKNALYGFIEYITHEISMEENRSKANDSNSL